MTIIIFLIVLSALVLVHEAGHFFVAKYFGIRVDEFGLGLPPKAKKLFSWKGTDFTLNWFPFGGFVKIFGENPEIESKTPKGDTLDPNPKGVSFGNSFQNKNRGIQSAVLVSGVVGNFIFAWFLLSLGFMIGMPTPADFSLPITNPRTIITEVVPDSPAQLAGLKSGDILSFADNPNPSIDEVVEFINESSKSIELTIIRGRETLIKTITPASGIVEGRRAIGIGMDTVGIAKLSLGQSMIQGFKFTVEITKLTAVALGAFILKIFIGQADFSQVTGPVGLVGIVGDVSHLGFVYLISLTALISINLAIINLFPFPALDGGRLLFVLIETFRRKAISPKIFNIANNVGFGLLIILMIVITFRDVVRLI